MGTKTGAEPSAQGKTELTQGNPTSKQAKMATVGMTRASARVSCNRQTRRVVVTRASAAQKKVESRREFARNAAMIAAAAVLSVVKTPAPAQAEDEIPEKLKKKICANNATAKICIKWGPLPGHDCWSSFLCPANKPPRAVCG